MQSRSFRFRVIAGAAVVTLGSCAALQWWSSAPAPGSVLDEARRASRAPDSFPAADEDYFREMDQNRNGIVALSPDEVKGRNTWLVWTAGDDRLWDTLTVKSFGHLDLLKTISSRSELLASRDNRWTVLGLVNEPCFEKATGPDPDRFGLWLDKRSANCPPDPFENEAKYPGVQIGSRGKPLPAELVPPAGTYFPRDGKVPVGSFYGYATGIVGLRLFPNPAFDEAAAKHWDAERYYRDPKYYNDKNLVRPYRVGMSCAFCHVGPNPLKPPLDPERPKWENLSSNVGAQYFWIAPIFDWSQDKTDYIFQMLHTARAGTLDTSLVSSDNINNPRNMNALYELGARLAQAQRFGKETLAGGSLNNKQFNDYVPPDSPLARFYSPPATVMSPRILKDGADSVGALGALNRVYLNIGLFSEEWLLHFNALVGGQAVTPIEIATARKNSSYWLATESLTPDIAKFFLKTAEPHKLQDAPGGSHYLSTDVAQLQRGKQIFAENCARCHSSKLPEHTGDLMPEGCSGPNYLTCWNQYWAWTKTADFKAQMTKIVLAPDFLDNNFLSSEFRIPVTLTKTNACSPLATNAIRDNIWDNFSSETYKQLPSVGTITVYDPVTGERKPYVMPAGGRGYTRPASLISVWSTAPFLLNNSVGEFNNDPTVAGRMRSFQSSIEQILWPESREMDSVLGNKVPGTIDRTTDLSYIKIDGGFLPDGLKKLGPQLFPKIFSGDQLQLGPIPRGTPVGLLANLMVRPEEMDFSHTAQHDRELVTLIWDIKRDLDALGKPPVDGQAREAFNTRALQVFKPLAARLMALSKCPDYVVNRGHYFGTGYDKEVALTDAQKRDLIEFLKTF